jgi:hypothetical protein
MSKYLRFTKSDGSKVRILRGTAIRFDLWVGAANAEQAITGVSTELTEDVMIVIGDKDWTLCIGDQCIDGYGLRDFKPARIGKMLFSICVTQILKHCEEC